MGESALSKLRKRAGLTTEDLAREAGVSYNTLAAHQRRKGPKGWKADTLLRVADVLAERLGVGVEEVIRELVGEKTQGGSTI